MSPVPDSRARLQRRGEESPNCHALTSKEEVKKVAGNARPEQSARCEQKRLDLKESGYPFGIVLAAMRE